MRAFAVVLCAALLLGAEPEPAPSPSPSATPKPNPYAILAKARDVFHAHVRPPYVVYTLERREWIDDFPDVNNSYTWRIWCRTRDDAAMWRIFYRRRDRALAGLHFIQPAFNEAVDPGPPTGDIFPLAPPPTPAPQPTGTERLRTIAVVASSADLDYRATFAGIDRGAYDLKLEPLRDWDRNRLRELWVDAETFEVRRTIAVDRLFLSNDRVFVPDRLDIEFAMHDAVPVLHKIRAVSQIPPSITRLGQREESQYFYDDVVFATSLPDWYFDPKTYRQHFNESALR